MTVIALVTANRVNVVESREQMTLEAAEAITAGFLVRIDTSAGTFTLANGSSAAEARVYGMALKTVAAGEPVTAVRKGVVDGHDLDSLAYDDDVFLSDTDGRADDTAGTVSTVIGKVIPAEGQAVGSNPQKLMLLDI